MAGRDFPSLDAGAVVSDGIYQPSHRHDVPSGLGELSSHLESVGSTLQEMAVRAADSEGKTAGAAAAAAGVVTPANPNTAYGQAYNAVAKQGLGEARRAAIVGDVGQALAANSDNPAALKASLDAVKKGYGSTGFPDLDAQLDGEFGLHAATALTEAQRGLHAHMVQAQASNFTTAETTAAGTLAQAASAATFDATGAGLVAGAVTNYAHSLAQYGPREAFQIGGVQIPADPTRAGLLSPEEINARGVAAAAEAKRTWMLSAQKGLGTADAQARFADDLRARYEKGDPIFAGLDGAHAESLFNSLDSQAAKSSQDERIGQASHAQSATNLIQAIQWGGKVDPTQLRAEAAASGNPALVAQADFYASVSSHVRGVLKTVVARQLGLIPGAGGGGGEGGGGRGIAPVLLDANGQPVAGGAAPPQPAGDDGAASWTPPPGVKPGTPAFAAWANTRSGFASDPVKFAVAHQVATVAPLIPQAAFAEDAGQVGGWSAAIRQRAGLAGSLQASYGVPSRMLTDAEREDYKSYLAANPAAVVPLAMRATAAIGGDGAQRFLREIGQDGDVATAVHIGNLAAIGNPVIAGAAAEGINLKAAGAKPIDDPMWRASHADALRKIAPAFSADPAVLVAATNVAELARLSDSQKGISYSPEHYLQSALGAAQAPGGHTWGGVVPVNGAPALLPAWLRQDQVLPALRAIGDSWAAHPGAGPVYANGQAMTGQDLARMQLVERPGGQYVLRNPQSGNYARLRDGSLLHLDFDAQRAFISGHLPGSVRR